MLNADGGPGVFVSAHPLPLRTLLRSAFHISAASHSASNIHWPLLTSQKSPEVWVFGLEWPGHNPGLSPQIFVV